MTEVLGRFVRIAKAAPQNNDDLLALVVGERRIGKSSLAFALGRKIDRTFNHTRMVFSFAQFRHLVYTLPRGSLIVVDECVEGFWSTDVVTPEGQEAEHLITVMGERGLIALFCLPDLAQAHRALKRACKYLLEVPRRGLAHPWKRNKKRQFSKSAFPGYQDMGYEPYPDPESKATPEKWRREWRLYKEAKAAHFIKRAQKKSDHGGYLDPEVNDVQRLAQSIRPGLQGSAL